MRHYQFFIFSSFFLCLQFKCSECTKYFTRKQNLDNHTFIHTGYKRKIECPSCGKLFINRTNLRVHFKSYHENWNASVLEEKAEWIDMKDDGKMKMRFACMAHTITGKLCNKSFTRKENLNYHIQNHHATSPSKLVLLCVHGELLFSSKSNLLKHIAHFHTSKSVSTANQ